MKTDRLWLPYVLPFALYLVFLTLQSNDNLLWMYPLKTVVVAGTLLCFARHYVELRSGIGRASLPASHDGSARQEPRPPAQNLALGAAIGLLAIVIWIAIDPFYPKFGALFNSASGWMNSLFGKPPPADKAIAVFDPTTIQPASLQYAWLACRVFGATVFVAFMEEIFWRGFLIRWLIKEDFQSVPMGTFSRQSFLITVLMFGLEHDQWLAGLICGALYNWLYYRTKNLFACVIAHATSNAILAGWVLARGDWKFW